MKETKKLPSHIYRSDDYTVFYLTDKGYCTSSTLLNPESGHYYTYDTLKYHGFVECTEKDLPLLAKKYLFMSDFKKWQCRSDGHGGVKGGDLDEYFRKHPGKLEEYDKLYDDEESRTDAVFDKHTLEILAIIKDTLLKINSRLDSLEEKIKILENL
jgi:hypothetical protein